MGVGAAGFMGGFGQALGGGLMDVAKLKHRDRELAEQRAFEIERDSARFQNQSELMRKEAQERVRQAGALGGMQMLMHAANQPQAPGFEGVGQELFGRTVNQLQQGELPDYASTMQEYTQRTTRPTQLGAAEGALQQGEQRFQGMSPLIAAVEPLAALGSLAGHPAIQALTQSIMPQASEAVSERTREVEAAPGARSVSGPRTPEEAAALQAYTQEQQLRQQFEHQKNLYAYQQQTANEYDPAYQAFRGARDMMTAKGMDPAQANLYGYGLSTLVSSIPELMGKSMTATGMTDPVSMVRAFDEDVKKVGKEVTGPGTSDSVGTQYRNVFIPNGPDRGWGMVASMHGYVDHRGQPIGPSLFSKHDIDPELLPGKDDATTRGKIQSTLMALEGVEVIKDMRAKNPELFKASILGIQGRLQNVWAKIVPGKGENDPLTEEEVGKINTVIAAQDDAIARTMLSKGVTPEEVIRYTATAQQVREQLARAATGAQAGFAELKKLYTMYFDIYSASPDATIDQLYGALKNIVHKKGGIIYLDPAKQLAKQEFREKLRQEVTTRFGDTDTMYGQAPHIRSNIMGVPTNNDPMSQGPLGGFLAPLFQQLMGPMNFTGGYNPSGGTSPSGGEMTPLDLGDAYSAFDFQPQQ